MKTMLHSGRVLLMILVLALAVAGPTVAEAMTYAGVVLAIDRTANTIVVGDMGPLLSSGESEIARRTIRVAPSTEFVRVKRAPGIAPTGWWNDYVETRLAAWDVKPGDFVTVTGERHGQGFQAVRITVVDTTEP